MDFIPSAAVVPEDDSRAFRLAELLTRLRQRFVVFASAWGAKVLLGAFGGFGILTPFHGSVYRVWVAASYLALGAMLLGYVLFGETTIRTAQAMGKERTGLWLYFAIAPVVAVCFPLLGAVPLGFFIYNAILASPIAVYLSMSRELEEEIRILSAIR